MLHLPLQGVGVGGYRQDKEEEIVPEFEKKNKRNKSTGLSRHHVMIKLCADLGC